MKRIAYNNQVRYRFLQQLAGNPYAHVYCQLGATGHGFAGLRGHSKHCNCRNQAVTLIDTQ
jgi:hypothetical protein